ncbi:macro domain-containing protein [Actinobaculum sp. 352]|uniref:macro domain-containing protein n=1 Tax=Actinobaculum sp. 352 TaxID=2490946 RepID=UPI001F494FDA|nr:macro domain-containing protein [Actinobaculum sp. 352]
MDRVITAPHEQLAACYRSCLPLTLDHELGSIMFSCISTGEFHFPHQEAAPMAVETVRNVLCRATHLLMTMRKLCATWLPNRATCGCPADCLPSAHAAAS